MQALQFIVQARIQPDLIVKLQTCINQYYTYQVYPFHHLSPGRPLVQEHQPPASLAMTYHLWQVPQGIQAINCYPAKEGKIILN